jgi:hypothetical protein
MLKGPLQVFSGETTPILEIRSPIVTEGLPFTFSAPPSVFLEDHDVKVFYCKELISIL